MLSTFLEYREQKMTWLSSLSIPDDNALIVFRINAPGAVKQTVDTLKIFQYGVLKLKEALNNQSISHELVHIPLSPPEWLAVFLVGAGSRQAKRVCIELEEKEACGRLFDFDVMNEHHVQISRTELGFSPRKCFICDELAFICTRERRHSLEQLNHYIAAKADTCF